MIENWQIFVTLDKLLLIRTFSVNILSLWTNFYQFFVNVSRLDPDMFLSIRPLSPCMYMEHSLVTVEAYQSFQNVSYFSHGSKKPCCKSRIVRLTPIRITSITFTIKAKYFRSTHNNNKNIIIIIIGNYYEKVIIYTSLTILRRNLMRLSKTINTTKLVWKQYMFFECQNY